MSEVKKKNQSHRQNKKEKRKTTYDTIHNIVVVDNDVILFFYLSLRQLKGVSRSSCLETKREEKRQRRQTTRCKHTCGEHIMARRATNNHALLYLYINT